MRPEGFIPANFSFSATARAFIDQVRIDAETRAHEPAAAFSVAWGTCFGNDGRTSQGIVVGFYMRSELSDDIASWVQVIDGMNVIFNTVPSLAPKFDGKVIDYSKDRWFFLRAPGAADHASTGRAANASQ